MKLVIRIILPALLMAGWSLAANFDGTFENKTLRIDYYHSGQRGIDHIALGQIYAYPVWSGSHKHMVSDLNLGQYQVRVFDAASNKLIYSRGYSTMFNEWQTTKEAKIITATFEESVLIPKPKRKFRLVFTRRDDRMQFEAFFDRIIDPNQTSGVNSNPPKPAFKVSKLMYNGPSENKVDLVIIGDGYSAKDMEKFRRDAKHYNDVMFSTSPFKEHKKDFNVWVVEAVSAQSGISKPDKNIWKSSALGCSYFSFASPRYVLTQDNKALRDAAGLAPYDYINILINDNRYGGGGIYNWFTTTYTISDHPGMEWQMDYVYVHEFGHAFAGLGDEYYSSSTGYDEFYKTDVEPWEPNITALLDKKNLKWKKFVTTGTPLPTPWNKKVYDSVAAKRSKLDRLGKDYYEKREPFISKQRALLKAEKYAGKVGAFEGAGYESHGLYRPAVDCRMFSLSLTDFDPVCSEAIVRVIKHLSE